MAEAKKTTTKKVAKKSEKKAINKPIADDVVDLVAEDTEVKKATAKAGKRSTKAIKESEEKQAKIERKAKSTAVESEKPEKPTQKLARPRIERMSKKYRKAAELIDKSKTFNVSDALELAVKTSTTKFDSSVELHVNLGVDPKQADQNVRGTVVLPAGTGKVIRIAVFADGDDIQAAKKAGADIAGSDELLQQLDKEQIEFDMLISTPMLMARLGKYARLLGPKGLMPNPKSGTVTVDVVKAVLEAKAGKLEYRVDASGIIHVAIGKVSFGKDKLASNANAVISSIKSAKPASLKNIYIKSAYFSTTMGPSIKIEIG